jgi:endo-1,4-beta-xylanase
MGQHYKSKFFQYDVNNENLHGFWYESKTSDKDFTEDMIRWMHQQDPNVQLCLNDYNVVADGMFTSVGA